MIGDHTTDPALTSWVDVPPGSDFPIQNLPFGVFRTSPNDPGQQPRVGVAIGARILDLSIIQDAGLFATAIDLPQDVFSGPSLNPYLALGRPAWRTTRARISQLLDAGNTELTVNGLDARAFADMANAQMLLPSEIGDYVDFYSSLEHASNVGKMFRPNEAPLLPNWRHLPVGYHGRSSSIVVGGTPITRPHGQLSPLADGGPRFGQTECLDIELEVGFVTGPGNQHGVAIPVADAERHIFGMCLVNDWSARDIQAWEYRPLGPFLGKSFATTISPWIVDLDALAPYRVPPPAQEPAPLPYLRTEGNTALDLHLEVKLNSTKIISGDFRGMYWTMAQQLAHATVNGTNVRPGDLYASGTVSGKTPESFGSLLERSWNGEDPLTLDDGTARTFLEDGDTVVIRGWCGGDGKSRIGFGECAGTVLPAHIG